MLTNGNPHGLRILQGLEKHKARIVAVVLEAPLRPRAYLNPSAGSGGKWLAWPRAVKRWLATIRRVAGARGRYLRYTERLVLTGALNSEQMRKDLEALAPDFILLGGIGILKAPLIHVARHGVINSHPGLLPWIRGTGVVGRALERGIPVGATCHYVSSGIDTGAMIERRLLPVTGKEASLAELEAGADQLTSELMVDVVVEQLLHGDVPAAMQQTTKFPMCSWMSAQERLDIDEQIRAGRAKQLFEGWRPACTGGDKCHLPADYQTEEI
jgi:methionyl-tRNA formyltransferase